jgi:hypothetical protein
MAARTLLRMTVNFAVLVVWLVAGSWSRLLRLWVELASRFIVLLGHCCISTKAVCSGFFKIYGEPRSFEEGVCHIFRRFILLLFAFYYMHMLDIYWNTVLIIWPFLTEPMLWFTTWWLHCHLVIVLLYIHLIAACTLFFSYACFLCVWWSCDTSLLCDFQM